MAGVSTSRIYATMLIQDEVTMLIPKDIVNAKAAIRSKLLANRTSNEALFKMLDDKGFCYCHEIDPESNRLIYLTSCNHEAEPRLHESFDPRLYLQNQPVPYAAPQSKEKQIALETDIFMAKFDDTVDSTTEDDFEERRAGLHRLNSAMGKYLDAQWWPHRTKFERCWTDQYSHFGCRETSTVEGTHATMKSWLDNS
ncbi:hypothetical protein F442_16055 [Phytophthora nicotianae P10297]|uniref:Uncharacterized protein n=1 Tax=Phytophthora nicotianae P10297 TaxID=1317064 RepID=W2YLS1_PHYNI|nr:hypothetical protein F442_16055 [Phytophthora nicotianae P10297]